MKKVVRVFILVILFMFVSIYIMVYIDNKSINDIEKLIIKNTDIKDIEYINMYGNSYIIMDKKYLYLFDNKYDEIDKLDVKDIYENKKNYDIVYRDNLFMYMDNYENKDGVIFRYYDIENYELVDEIMVGGN